MSALPDTPVMFGPLLAFYTVAAFRPRSVSVPVDGGRRSWAGLVMAVILPEPRAQQATRPVQLGLARARGDVHLNLA